MMTQTESTQRSSLPHQLGAPQSPSGYLTFGLCAMLLGFHQLGIFDHPMLVAAGFLYGGTCQALVGLNEWRRGNAFGAVTFTSCGLLWLSLLPLLILPQAGIGSLPEASASAPYLVMWGIYCLILSYGSATSHKLSGLIFGVGGCLLFLTAATTSLEYPLLRQITCSAGIFCGALSTLRGLSLIRKIRMNSNRTFLPAR